jgi:hypothetical protein
MAASDTSASLDLDQILALAGRAERGQLASEDGALVAKLLVLLVDSVQLVRAVCCFASFSAPALVSSFRASRVALT